MSAQDGPYVSPNPPEYTAPEVGHSFTVDINVTDVTNLVGVGAYIWYNTTILDAVECTAHPDAANLAPIDPITFEWVPINDTLGRIMFGYTFWPPKSGNLTLLTINFTATGKGTTDLNINGTSLVDPMAQEIEHAIIDGSITVGPPPALPLISLNPIESTVVVEDSFTIDVNITDISDLGAWEFKLNYNTTILDATEVMYEGRMTENNTNWLPTDPDTHQWNPINDTLGRVWVGARFPLGQEFTGNGTLVTINFTATEVGNCTLQLYDTKLANSIEDPINHDVGPVCFVTVIAKPPLPLLSLYPLEYTVYQGESFNIDVNITDIADLQEYEFNLWFNNTLLNATDVTPGPVNPLGTVFIPDPLQNVSDGLVRVEASLPVGQMFTGSGIMVTIDFTALVAGECTLHLNETVLTDSMEAEIDHVTLDGAVTVIPEIGDCHKDHLNDPTDDFPNDYTPMIISVNGKNVMIAPVIRSTCHVGDVFEPDYWPDKLAQTLFDDDNWGDNDAKYTYLFEDWTDYDWNDINVSLYAVINEIIEVGIHIEDREAEWKNPFGIEITPQGLAVEVHWNSTDYPENHVIKVNPGETEDIELFYESNLGDTAFLKIVPLIPPTASFVYSPPNPQVCENVTFNASASTPNGGYITSYKWDLGDSSPHEFGMIVTHHYTTAGIYNVTLNVTDSDGKWNTESKMITVTPRTYTLTITSTAGGTTAPVPGNYLHEEGTVVSAIATPESSHILDHWELDGVNVGSDTSTSVTMDKNHALHAIFEEAGPSLPVGGQARPIDKTHLLSLQIDLVSRIGLAFVLLVAMAATSILIRRRNKILRWGH